ncbi:MAG: hypothetical protein AB7T49_06995 [Oligoflexales bacterium]
MTPKLVVVIWLAITVFMAKEYVVLNKNPKQRTMIGRVSCQYFGHCQPMYPEAGKPLSFALGVIGFSTICLTNFYIMRKHFMPMRTWGKLQTWLNWHILFGLLGPTLIIFHTNFDVNGLVAISFWSMMVSMTSGIVGRYLYVQLLQSKEGLRQRIDVYEQGFEKYLKLVPAHRKALDLAKSRSFLAAGGMSSNQMAATSLAPFLIRSFVGEMRIRVALPSLGFKAPPPLRAGLREWAILRKRLISLHYYKVIFGYWHSFHMPFAIFMYVVAIIHIISSLIFKVG